MCWESQQRVGIHPLCHQGGRGCTGQEQEMQQPWEKCLRVTFQQELGRYPSISRIPSAWHSWRMDQDPDQSTNHRCPPGKRHPNKGSFDGDMIFLAKCLWKIHQEFAFHCDFFIAVLGSERAVPSLQDLPGWDKIQGKLETWHTAVVESEPGVAF